MSSATVPLALTGEPAHHQAAGADRPPRPSRLSRAITLLLLAVAVTAVWFTVRAGGPDLIAAGRTPAFWPLAGAALLTNGLGLVLAMLSWRAVLIGEPSSAEQNGSANANANQAAVVPTAQLYFVGLLGKLVPAGSGA